MYTFVEGIHAPWDTSPIDQPGHYSIGDSGSTGQPGLYQPTLHYGEWRYVHGNWKLFNERPCKPVSQMDRYEYHEVRQAALIKFGKARNK